MDDKKPTDESSSKSKPAPGGDKPSPKPRPAAKKKAAVDEEALRAPVPSRCLDRLKEVHGDALEEDSFHCGVPIVRVKPNRIVEVCRFLKEDADCRMTHLADLCGVDASAMERPSPRFDVVYHLFSLETKERIALKAAVEEDGSVETVSGVWRTANWHEREAFDMFGIRFKGHPDLRRILMPYEFDAYPLRKDFPLEGREKDHGYWRQPEDER